MPDDEPHGAAYEAKHVHEVYESIAEHFSGTRYKPWPIVSRFLQALPCGAVGLDVGAGNGKYLPVNRDVFILASDRSPSLMRIAACHEPHAAVVADGLALPHMAGTFDFAISIAVVHHLSTRDRRIQGIREILRLLRNGGQVLVYVWALEQKDSRRGWDKGDEQDVLVPWVTKVAGTASASDTTTYHRYYHLYREGELEEDIRSAGGIVVEAGYEKDNWWAVARPLQPEDH